MRLAIMQPYFFPYLGHFSLIAACDTWVVFDVSQYTPRGWMNRNRVLRPGGGCQWVSVPLAGASIHMRTWEARILDPAGARDRVLRQLGHYRRAPYYDAVVAIVGEAFLGAGTSLVRLNVQGLGAVCRYLGLGFRPLVCSELGLRLPADPGPGGWAPAICSALGATGYVNPVGGRALFDPAVFSRLGIGLSFLAAEPFVYATRGLGFEPGLSVLDVLMWNAPEAVLGAVRRYAVMAAGDAGLVGASS